MDSWGRRLETEGRHPYKKKKYQQNKIQNPLKGWFHKELPPSARSPFQVLLLAGNQKTSTGIFICLDRNTNFPCIVTALILQAGDNEGHFVCLLAYLGSFHTV